MRITAALNRVDRREGWVGALAGGAILIAVAPCTAQIPQSGSTSVPASGSPSAPAGSVQGGVQPASSTTTSAPATVELGSVQGYGGGIRPPRLSPTSGAPLVMEQAVRISLANNLNIFTAAAQDEKAKARVDETKTNFLPKPGLSANYTYTGNVATVTLPLVAGGPPETIALSTHTNAGAALSVTEPIDTSGALSASKEVAEAQQSAQDWALESARRQVILTTEAAYLGVLRAQSLRDVAMEELKDAQDHVSISQKMLDAGTIARYDLLTAQSAEANVRQQWLAAQHSLDDALAALDNAMGISQATTLQLSPLNMPAETPVPEFAPSLVTAEKNRPELKQIDANVVTARQSIRLAAAGLKPTLGLQGSYNYTAYVSSFGGLQNNWTVGVVGSWTPFDWGATRDRMNQAHEDEVTNQYLREQAAQGIEYQVRQAINQISDALQNRTATETTVAQAREQLRLANLRFNTGTGTNTEVLDAESNLAQSEASATNALYDYFAARANFERATGTEPLARK